MKRKIFLIAGAILIVALLLQNLSAQDKEVRVVQKPFIYTIYKSIKE